MENQNQNSGMGHQTINIQVPSTENIASRRPLIPLLFAITVIFFFFNFFTVSCGGEKIGSVKGIDLVTGTQLKSKDMFSGRETEGEKIPSSAWAIIAFGAAIIGLGAFLMKEKREAVVGTGAGAIGFASLLILQFVVKNAIEEKSEGAPLVTDFQFAYWGALIAMGIAGFISYLRMQKTHSIVVSFTPQSNPTAPDAVNFSQPNASDNLIQQTNNFDAGEWFSKNVNTIIKTVGIWVRKNSKFLVGIAGTFIVVFGIYYLLLRHDPTNDGKNIASSICDCAKVRETQLIECYQKYLSDFDSYNFSGRQEARQKLETLIQEINNSYEQCYAINQEKLLEFKKRYITNQEKIGKFEYAFNAMQGLCNNNNNELNSLNSQVLRKISNFIGTVEIEQARQDSIAAVKAAEIAEKLEVEKEARLAQAEAAFMNATKKIPSIEQIKTDIIGKQLINAPWNFDKPEEIIGFRQLGVTFQKDSRLYIGKFEINLEGYRSKRRSQSIALVTYYWDIYSDTWNFQRIVSQEFKYIN